MYPFDFVSSSCIFKISKHAMQMDGLERSRKIVAIDYIREDLQLP